MARRKKLFRKMNPPSGTTALVVGTLILVTAGGAYLLSNETQAKPKKSCKPYKFNELAVRASLEDAIDSGVLDPMQLAVDTSTELFGRHPTGANVVFPPIAKPLAGVACVWERVLGLIALIFDERGITPSDGETDDPSDGIDIVIHDPSDDGYPWEEFALDAGNYPTPGMFADVGDSKTFDYSRGTFAVADAALDSAIAMAAARGIDVSVAQNIMAHPNTSQARDFKAQMVNVIFCSPWNDALYGREVPSAEKKSPDNLYGWVANGRSPRYGPVHNDILGMLVTGKRPLRSITVNGSRKSGMGRRSPVFWIPAINLEKLGGPFPSVTVSGMTWSDGSSTSQPPPIVQKLGVDMGGVSLPGGPGCK